MSAYFSNMTKQFAINYNPTFENECPEMDQVGIIHYFLHHEVRTSSKATTKLRIVYDASSQQKGEKRLNDVLYQGPTTLPDLIGVLLRF